MKICKTILLIALSLSVVAFGIFLPQIIAPIFQTVDAFPIESVDLDYIMERTITERLQMSVLGHNKIYRLPNGHHLTKPDLIEASTELAQAIYPEASDVRGLTAEAFLVVDTDGVSSVVWLCSAVADELEIYYSIDDATGAVLNLEIRGDNILTDVFAESADAKQWNVTWEEAEDLLTRLAKVLQENLQYDDVTIENIQDTEAFDDVLSCDFVFYDAENKEFVRIPVSLPIRFYLKFNDENQ